MAVDAGATAEAFVRLLEDAGLRMRMGAAGRQRACERFAWPQTIRAYEALWRQQAGELAESPSRDTARQSPSAPSAYPPPERSFAGYPSRWLDNEDVVVAAPDANRHVAIVAATPLTNYESGQRCSTAARRSSGEAVCEL